MFFPLNRAKPFARWDARLQVAWESRWQNFRGSLSAFFENQKSPEQLPAEPFFRDAWVNWRVPKQAMVASLVWHIVLINIAIPLGKFSAPRTKLLPPRIEVTWYGRLRELRPLVLPGPPAKPNPPGERTKSLPPRAADAFHPRETIISAPLRPTHPRQTLIETAAPPQPPKILPQLPNAVDWANSPAPAALRLPISAAALARLHPKRASPQIAEHVSVPQLPNQEMHPGALSIAASLLVNPQPSLPMAPSGPLRPQTPQARPVTAAVPAIGTASNHGEDNLGGLIALSTSPGGSVPPPGNVMARFTISPEGTQPDVPGGSPAGTPGATESTSGAGGLSGGGKGIPGPPGVSISEGNQNAAFSSDAARLGGIRLASPVIAAPLLSKPEPRLAMVRPNHTPPAPALNQLQPASRPEEILGFRHVYTLLINMPNLTSSTGSWVLNFSQWDSEGTAPSRDHDPVDLDGPVPLRKVDPKYPPELIEQHVEGEVVLYAIIRADGTVDSIRVLQGLDPQLDLNAMRALARWKFRPASRHGQPVELEAVVRIPFHAAVPVY